MVDCERLEYLGENISVYINKEHRFGTDAFLLADFASPKKKDTACDLGTGCGIIPFLWFRDGVPARCFGVEINKDAADMAKRSAEYNGLEDRLTFINSDLRDKLPVEAGSLDLVTCNPPYFKQNSGESSKIDSRGNARHELMCTSEDVIKCAARLLKFSGRLCICQRPDRLADIVCLMRENKIEPKRLRFIHKDVNSAPWLFLIEGKRGGKSGLIIEEPFYLEKENGEYSERMLKIYKLYGGKRP